MAVRRRILLAVLLLACACSRPPPEQRLRDSIGALGVAIEARDAGDLKQLLAADFVGPGGLDRDGAVRTAQLLFLQHRDIGVHLGPLDLSLQGEHARARFQAALTGGEGGALPDAARLYDVETGWRLEHGAWRLTSATWTPRL